MNVFSVLDTSDNEDEQPQKTTAANQQGKKPASAGNNAKADTKPKEKAPPRVIPGLPPAPTKANKDSAAAPPAAPSANEAEGSKDNIRGGRPRGKEGFRRGDKHNADRKEGDKEPSYPGKKGKREFERRSGTGRGKELSRGGRGPYGFGNVEQEAQEAEKNPEVAGEAGAEGEAATAEDSTPAAAEESTPEPEQPKVLTFEDYLRQRNEARANSSVLGAQKPVRAVKADFAGLVQVSNNEVEDDNKGDKSKAKKEKSSNKTQIVDVGFRFEAPEAAADRPFKRREGDSREGRNGRKPFEGKRDNARPQRSGDNNGPRRQAPSAAINPEDFPAL